MAAQIDAHARDRGAELILAGDAATTRLLVQSRPHLATPCYPLPELEAFDALATKDRFAALCRTLRICHPRSQVFECSGDLLAAVNARKLGYPAVLKPLNRAGGIGVIEIEAANARSIAAGISYAPILVQEFIAGEDRSITVFCQRGRVLRQATYTHPDGCFRFMREPALERIVAEIACAMKLSGIFNFDARIDGLGRVWMLECNPRVFFNIDVAMVAGMNFISSVTECGDAPETLADAEVRIPPATLANLMRGSLPTSADWRMLRHWLRDPVMLLRCACGHRSTWKASRTHQDAQPLYREQPEFLATSRAIAR